MEHLLLIIVGILLLIIFVLLAKVYFLHKSAQELAEAFQDRLAADTNTLIDISTRDPYMRKLAADINVQLRLLRQQRHKYLTGDRELKEAVTNISHDLRTPLTAICGYLDLLDKEDKSENTSRYLSLIGNRVEAMKQLTEELFRYSVILSTGELVLEPVCVNGVLEESIAAFYGVLTNRGIQPEIHITENRIERQLNRESLPCFVCTSSVHTRKTPSCASVDTGVWTYFPWSTSPMRILGSTNISSTDMSEPTVLSGMVCT